MKRLIIIILSTFFILTSCEKNDESITDGTEVSSTLRKFISDNKITKVKTGYYRLDNGTAYYSETTATSNFRFEGQFIIIEDGYCNLALLQSFRKDRYDDKIVLLYFSGN